MAFNLQKVLRALLFSSSQPLSVKDIQAAFARFHNQATLPDIVEGEERAESALPASVEGHEPIVEGDSAAVGTDVASSNGLLEAGIDVAAAEPVLVVEGDADIYGDVPSLITATQIREAMAVIAEELRVANDIFLLIDGPTGYRIVTHPRYARWIRILRDEPPPVKLNQSALETLAIIAYRQPVTRTEIETIRGVSAEAGLNKLLERVLVYIVGRADLPGRPLQYGTTDKFLDFVGVKSLIELPASDVLSPRQIDEWLTNAINSKPPADAEMGLPLEEGEGESPNLEAVQIERVASSEILAEDSIESPIESDQSPASDIISKPISASENEVVS